MLHASEYGLSDVQSEGCYYITFKCRLDNPYQLLRQMCHQIQKEGVNVRDLVFAGECPIIDKYDDVIPPELLRLAYGEDRLDIEEAIARLMSETT